MEENIPAARAAEAVKTLRVCIYYIMRNLKSRSNVHAETGFRLTTVNVGKKTASSQSSSATACFLGVPLPAI